VIQNLDIITPKSIEEQKKIVDFIDKETEKIDNHIKKVEKRIELLKEYKKSLIYNVVTGKVEV
jgi:type I restriction enzyme S subunit